MENNNTNVNDEIKDASAETQPEENGIDTGKTFTQEEVNHIISDRLKRATEKAEAAAAEHYVGKLTDLENSKKKLECKEFLIENGYPLEMLDVINTSDVERFKNVSEKLYNSIINHSRKNLTAPSFMANEHIAGGFDEAFSRGFNHIPKNKERF